jgi:catechol 2,3-dioxygenase-like lactoylglutathione lyase family enzyme
VAVEESRVLAAAHIEAVVPVSDLEAALRFYGGTLGLRVIEQMDDVEGPRETRLAAGEGSLTIYESESAGKSGATIAAFLVEDLDGVLAELRSRGVAPIDFDLPHLRTEGGVATIGRTRVAWIADPDGNLIAVNTV